PLLVVVQHRALGVAELLEALELAEADGRAEVGHVVPEADVEHVVLPGPLGLEPAPSGAVDAEHAHPHRAVVLVLVLEHARAALARGHVLDRVEGEAGHVAAGAPRHAVLVPRTATV